MSGATFADILALPSAPAAARIPYGGDPEQFGDLRLPTAGRRPHAVVVFIHGGCWESEYDLTHADPAATALMEAGVAVWSLEYRRLGRAGGGWPQTFLDVAAGVDALRTLALSHPLDLTRVVLMGHSAGGHLALWAAARRRVRRESEIHTRDPLRVRGVVALAGISDLRTAFSERVCDTSPGRLLGPPDRHGDRYAQASPLELLPLGVAQRLVHGSHDAIVPASMSVSYADAARAAGDDARAVIVEGAGHFDVISPAGEAWRSVVAAVRELFPAS